MRNLPIRWSNGHVKAVQDDDGFTNLTLSARTSWRCLPLILESDPITCRSRRTMPFVLQIPVRSMRIAGVGGRYRSVNQPVIARWRQEFRKFARRGEIGRERRRIDRCRAMAFNQHKNNGAMCIARRRRFDSAVASDRPTANSLGSTGRQLMKRLNSQTRES